jgi:WD40 repeat protein
MWLCGSTGSRILSKRYVSTMKLGAREQLGWTDSTQQQQRGFTRRPMHAALHYPRVTGTAVIASFLFILSWHFLGGWITIRWAQNSTIISGWNMFQKTRGHPHGFNSVLEKTADSVNWLKFQEYETAMEILHAVNPGSFSFSARVYNPLVIVLNSTNRKPLATDKIFESSPVNASIFGPHWPSAVIFCGSAALLLALWICSSSNDTPGDAADDIHKPETLSSVQCLPRGHSLDIFIIVTSSNRTLASVGFDHEIRVWNLESRITSSQLVPISQQPKLWPVATIAIDSKNEWLAICSKSGNVCFWNTRRQQFGQSTIINLDSRIIACFFTPSTDHGGQHTTNPLLLVSAAGCLTDIEVETAHVISHQICTTGVQSAHVNSHRRMPLRLITVSKDNVVYVTARREDRWTSHALNFSVPILSQPSKLRVTIIPDLRMVALVLRIDTGKLYLIDLLSG